MAISAAKQHILYLEGGASSKPELNDSFETGWGEGICNQCKICEKIMFFFLINQA